MTDTVFKSTSGRSPRPYTERRRSAGEWIFEEGSLGTAMYIVQEGEVEIVKDVGGQEDRQLAMLEKGDFFGEMALLEGLPRAAGARALSDVRLLEIDGATFDKMLRDNPEIAVRMMRKLSRRLRETDALLRELGAPSLPAGPPAPPAGDETELGSAPEATEEALVHERSNTTFHLARGSETTIGRKDPVTGIYPDVDLAPLDAQRSISRRHARIERRAGKLFLTEEIGTMNGTFVNGERLETGVPTEVRAGDRLRFGVVDLELRG